MLRRQLLISAAAGPLLAAPFLARAQVQLRDLASLLAATGGFVRWLELSQRAGMLDTLRSPQPMTLFAPTESAFDRMPAGIWTDLVGPATGGPDQARLRALVSHHILLGVRTTVAEKGRVEDVPSLNGGLLRLDGTGPSLTVAIARPSGGPIANNPMGAGGFHLQPPAQVTLADLAASNGVLHAIDRVLLP